MVVMVVVLLLL